MSRFLDVTMDKWYYNELVEASNMLQEDGDPMIVGIPYNVFEEGKPYVYKEFKATAGQKEFMLDVNIVPSSDNPLFVYIDGVQTVYKNVTNEGGGTKIELYSSVPGGAIVSIASYGVPKVDEFGRPFQTTSGIYPSVALGSASNYYYNAFQKNMQEYVTAFGRRLKRAGITNEEWAGASDKEALLKEHIRYDDVYFIDPDGVLHVPFNLNNVTCYVVYMTNEGYIKTNTEKVIPTSSEVLYLNRAFPDSNITRAEVFVLIDRVRRTFYNRFSDTKAVSYNIDSSVTAYSGQRSVSVQGRYAVGEDDLEVYLNGEKQEKGRDYEEYNEYTIIFKGCLDEGDVVDFKSSRTKSLHLEDVGVHTKYYIVGTGTYLNVNGTVGNENPKDDSWWAPHILALEQELLSTGELIVNGMPVSGVYMEGGVKVVPVNSIKDPLPGGNEEVWFMPNTFMTRAQAITILNRFRKLMMERFL